MLSALPANTSIALLMQQFFPVPQRPETMGG
jgi:hypothetical protein